MLSNVAASCFALALLLCAAFSAAVFGVCDPDGEDDPEEAALSLPPSDGAFDEPPGEDSAELLLGAGALLLLDAELLELFCAEFVGAFAFGTGGGCGGAGWLLPPSDGEFFVPPGLAALAALAELPPPAAAPALAALSPAATPAAAPTPAVTAVVAALSIWRAAEPTSPVTTLFAMNGITAMATE
jgi:hypothetical protein